MIKDLKVLNMQFLTRALAERATLKLPMCVLVNNDEENCIDSQFHSPGIIFFQRIKLFPLVRVFSPLLLWR